MRRLINRRKVKAELKKAAADSARETFATELRQQHETLKGSVQESDPHAVVVANSSRVSNSGGGDDDYDDSGGNFDDQMSGDTTPEDVLLRATWYTARMICTVSYEAIKSFRKKEGNYLSWQVTPQTYGEGSQQRQIDFGQAVQPPVDAPAPWDSSEEVRLVQVKESMQMPPEEEQARLHELDRKWIEDLYKASEARVTNGNRRLLREMQVLTDKIDNLAVEAVYTKLKCATKLLLEYLQASKFRTAYDTLQQAERAAKEVYFDEKSLVLTLSALRIRIVITYLHCSKDNVGYDPTDKDKESKRQCKLYLSNTLKQSLMDDLCFRFLSSRDDPDTSTRQRVTRETIAAFDIVLEVISSIHVLEPFDSSEALIPENAPGMVKHALAEYCANGLGASRCYSDLSRAFVDWKNTPDNRERFALHKLFTSTNGDGWTCKQGWGSVFDCQLYSMYGVTVDQGRVTKLSLGFNNLKGHLPPHLGTLEHLTEISLPGNYLSGEIPETLWELPVLHIVALQDNSYKACPPRRFKPASQHREGPESSSNFVLLERPKQRKELAAILEPCHPHRLAVGKHEWFPCSWKITNVGSRPFPSDTRLVKENEDSFIKGTQTVHVNSLRPGEEQTVYVMQQAPEHESFYKDQWNLTGEGLDFLYDEDAKTMSPLVEVVGNYVSNKIKNSKDKDEQARPSLANDVFIAPRSRHASSQHSWGSFNFN